MVGDSVFGIANRYGLDGPEVDARRGARFSAPIQTGSGTHKAQCAMGIGSFPVVKRPECCVDHPFPYTVEVKERVEAYI